MAEKPQKLFIPKDPVQIGTTPDGQPIHLDLKELIPTPDENLERWAKTQAQRRLNLINGVAYLVLKNATLFIEQTFWNTASQTGQRVYESGNAFAAFTWASQNGYEAIQDGLRTVVKKNGKIISSMDAKLSESLRDDVARRVNELVKKLPMPK